MQASITALYAGILSIIVLVLAAKVVRGRRRDKVGIGYGESKELRRAIRVHSNAVENLPFTLILMFILEVNGGPTLLLHICGAVTVIARILHAFGLGKSPGTTFGRLFGAGFTWLVMAVLALANIYYALGISGGG